jgi:hypothetical protein
MSYDGNTVTTLVPAVARVLNLLWTWNYCCKLEIVCADGSTFVVTKGFLCTEGRSLTENVQFFSYGTLKHYDWEPYNNLIFFILSTTMLAVMMVVCLN